MEVTALAFSRDGKMLASGGFDSRVLLHELGSGRKATSLCGHRYWIRTVAFSADGRWLATGSTDKSTIVWDVMSGRKLFHFKAHRFPVSAVVFDPAGRWLATAGCDRRTILWDLDTGGRIADGQVHRADITSIAVTGDGEFLLTASVDGTAILRETAGGDTVMTYGGDCGRLSSAAFAREERIILAGSSDGTVYFWDRESGRRLARLHCLDGGILWSAPADEAAASGWFFTDRDDVVHIVKCREDGSDPEVLPADDPERSVHLELYNRKEMVVGRLNDPQRYQREVDRIVGGVQASWLETYGARMKNRLIGHDGGEE